MLHVLFAVARVARRSSDARAVLAARVDAHAEAADVGVVGVVVDARRAAGAVRDAHTVVSDLTVCAAHARRTRATGNRNVIQLSVTSQLVPLMPDGNMQLPTQ